MGSEKGWGQEELAFRVGGGQIEVCVAGTGFLPARP
jgi:hypothetical protein